MNMPCEKHFKIIRKFWFQDRHGYRHSAKVCCVVCCPGVNELPAEVSQRTITTQINGGSPIVTIEYVCAVCGKTLELV